MLGNLPKDIDPDRIVGTGAIQVSQWLMIPHVTDGLVLYVSDADLAEAVERFPNRSVLEINNRTGMQEPKDAA